MEKDTIMRCINLNGLDYFVPKQVFEFVTQLLEENQEMVDLLEDAYFINREKDNMEVVSQPYPCFN